MSRQHKLALLGCGDVAVRDYLPELHRLADRIHLEAVYSRSEARARAVAAEYGARTWYTDYRQMLADTDVDIVANFTPIPVHVETTQAALEAGKHVYSEKPIATKVSDAQHLHAEAKHRGLTLICAPCVMLFPQVRLARTLLIDETIGPVYSARGQGHGGVPPWSGYTSDPSPFFTAGAGPAMDMGVYPLHALIGLLGPVRRVSAMSARVQSSFFVKDGPSAGTEVKVNVDDNWHLLLDFGDGCLASLEASNCVQATRAPQLELMGLRGTIAVNLLDGAAPVDILRPDDGWRSLDVPHARLGGGPDHLLGLEHLVDCLDRGLEPVLGIESAIHVIDVLEKAALSARTGRTLSLESTF